MALCLGACSSDGSGDGGPAPPPTVREFAYFPDPIAHAVVAFRVDTEYGGLTPASGTALPPYSYPHTIAITPSGKFAFVTGSYQDLVLGYSIQPRDGGLEPGVRIAFRSGLGAQSHHGRAQGPVRLCLQQCAHGHHRVRRRRHGHAGPGGRLALRRSLRPGDGRRRGAGPVRLRPQHRPRVRLRVFDRPADRGARRPARAAPRRGIESPAAHPRSPGPVRLRGEYLLARHLRLRHRPGHGSAHACRRLALRRVDMGGGEPRRRSPSPPRGNSPTRPARASAASPPSRSTPRQER